MVNILFLVYFFYMFKGGGGFLEVIAIMEV